MPKISVVIRALNEAPHLGRLLSGLASQTRTPDEIVLVDSGSTDETVQIAQAADCKIVHIDRRDFTFGRSLNYGCGAASGDVLVIMSAHVYPVDDRYLEQLTKPLSDGAADIVYGRQVGDHRTKFSESRVMLTWFPEVSIWDQKNPFSNNANAAVRREVWDRYRYDENLTGLEDLEFAKRVLADGGRVTYVAEAPVVHVHEETWDVIRNRYKREAIAYRTIMQSPPMAVSTAVFLGMANAYRDCVDAARSGQLGKNLSGIFRFRFAQFCGAWEGFRAVGHVDEQLLRRFYYPNTRTTGAGRPSRKSDPCAAAATSRPPAGPAPTR